MQHCIYSLPPHPTAGVLAILALVQRFWKLLPSHIACVALQRAIAIRKLMSGLHCRSVRRRGDRVACVGITKSRNLD